VREVLNGGHTLLLERGLENEYIRSETIIYANVVEATHGETVAGEVLGNGDASVPFQRFELKQSPLTYVSQVGAPGGAAPVIDLRVNGIRWYEVRSFYGRGGDEAVYTIDITDEQATIIRLGDGITGALPSSGRNNITADYRKGTGSGGNLPAGVIKTALERPKGLKSVFNPLSSSGGTDPETLEEIRHNAPNTVRTFGRIVSLRDFEDAAREFIGVAKARAFIDWDGEFEVVKLIVAGEEGTPIVEPQRSTLIADLNSRRDANRKMSVLNYCKVDIQLLLTVYPHEDYVADVVASGVRDALDAFFAFDRLALGQSVALSEVYSAIHEVEGVVGVEITRFRPLATGDCDALPADPIAKSEELLQTVVQIEPYELAALDTGNVSNFDIIIGESES
jgi:predicted phage baseplate assembly protein